jgi:predicted dehydrogenase
MSIEEVDRMIQTAKENNVLFTVHQNRRWDKDFRIVKEIIETGELGNVYAIHSRLHGTRGAMFGWRAEPEHGGGMIYDWGVHFVDQLMWMLGFDAIKSVFCKTVKVKTPEVEDYFFLLLDLKNGAHVQMEVGTWVLNQLPRWMILGDEGTAYINDFTRSGGIAGSWCQMDTGVTNLAHAGLPLEEVIQAASMTPAAYVRMTDKLGSIAPGKMACLAAWDEDIRCLWGFDGKHIEYAH